MAGSVAKYFGNIPRRSSVVGCPTSMDMSTPRDTHLVSPGQFGQKYFLTKLLLSNNPSQKPVFLLNPSFSISRWVILTLKSDDGLYSSLPFYLLHLIGRVLEFWSREVSPATSSLSQYVRPKRLHLYPPLQRTSSRHHGPIKSAPLDFFADGNDLIMPSFLFLRSSLTSS